MSFISISCRPLNSLFISRLARHWISFFYPWSAEPSSKIFLLYWALRWCKKKKKKGIPLKSTYRTCFNRSTYGEIICRKIRKWWSEFDWLLLKKLIKIQGQVSKAYDSFTALMPAGLNLICSFQFHLLHLTQTLIVPSVALIRLFMKTIYLAMTWSEAK